MYSDCLKSGFVQKLTLGSLDLVHFFIIQKMDAQINQMLSMPICITNNFYVL